MRRTSGSLSPRGQEQQSRERDRPGPAWPPVPAQSPQRKRKEQTRGTAACRPGEASERPAARGAHERRADSLGGPPPLSDGLRGRGGAQAGRGARPQQPAGVAGFVNTHFLPFPLCCQGLRAPPGLLRTAPLCGTTATPTRLRPRWSRQAVEGQTGTRDPAGAGARPLPPHTRGVPTIKLLSTAQALTVRGWLPPPRPAAALHQLLPPWGTFRSRDRDPPRSERQKNRFL